MMMRIRGYYLYIRICRCSCPSLQLYFPPSLPLSREIDTHVVMMIIYNDDDNDDNKDDDIDEGDNDEGCYNVDDTLDSSKKKKEVVLSRQSSYYYGRGWSSLITLDTGS